MTRLEYLQAVKKLLPVAPVCAEIGVYRGDFSKMILEELEPNSLLLIDSWSLRSDDVYDDGNKVMYSTINEYHYVYSRFNNKVKMFPFGSERAYNAAKFNSSTFDFIYIDADHRYESVKKDLEIWYELLSDNGCIGGHDYGNEIFKGVKQAVDEFVIKNNLVIKLLSHEGDFLLSK